MNTTTESIVTCNWYSTNNRHSSNGILRFTRLFEINEKQNHQQAILNCMGFNDYELNEKQQSITS